MPPAKIVYREQDIRRMIEVLNKSSKELQDVKQQMLTTSRLIQDDTLLGQGGTDLQQAINQSLCSAIDKLSQKMDERSKYVQKELDELLTVAKQTSRQQY